MAKSHIVTIDLNFQGKTQAIASYLIRHNDGAVLIESGPGSTLSSLEAGLAKEGLSPRDVTHVLLTHIHLFLKLETLGKTLLFPVVFIPCYFVSASFRASK